MKIKIIVQSLCLILTLSTAFSKEMKAGDCFFSPDFSLKLRMMDHKEDNRFNFAGNGNYKGLKLNKKQINNLKKINCGSLKYLRYSFSK